MNLSRSISCICLSFILALPLAACGQTAVMPQDTTIETTTPIETALSAIEAPMETIPAEEPIIPCTVNYLFYDEEETGKVEIEKYAVQELEETYHFILEYSTTESVQIEGYLSTAETAYLFLEEDSLSDGRKIQEFDIPREAVSEYTQMDLFFVPETGENIALSVYFPMRIQQTGAKPMDEPIRPGYTLRKKWKSDAYQIHDCYVQHLDNSHIRYTLDITLPKRAYFSVYLADGLDTALAFQMFSVNGRYQYIFDIPDETFAATREVNILICEERSRYENLISIPCGMLNACTDGMPVSDPIPLEFFAKDKKGYSILGCTVQELDNGFLRYTLEYTAPQDQLCSVFDPPDGDSVFFKFITGQEDDIKTFSFDVEKRQAEILQELTFLAGRNYTAVIKNPGIP